MFPFVWFNGEVVPAVEARIPALSPGFLYGVGAFETMRHFAERGIFRLRAHLERLSRALELFGLPVPLTTDDTRNAIDALVRANAVNRDVVVRLTVAAGENFGSSPVAMIHLREVGYPAELCERGVSACVEEAIRVDELARHKTLNYAACLLAKRRAASRGFDEALFQDADGRFLEGATTNLFVVRDGILKTPPTTRPILPGITRGVVLELTEGLGMSFREEDVRREDLAAASEAFLTNSVGGILPLANVWDGRFSVHLEINRHVGRTLRDAYESLVRSETQR